VSALNLAVRFACELAAIAALVWWGWLLIGILAGAAVIVVWGAFIGPKAPRRLSDPYRLVVELGIFVVATIGFHGVGQTVVAVMFAAAALASALLVRVWPEPVG